MSELTSLMNIGKEMERKLISVGIESPEELIKTGAKDAFLKLKQKYPNICLVHLYTLEGAIHDTEYNRLSEDTKKELKEFSNFLKK
ncbi:MAG: TfoX/Sxy family protein [Lachnospiraceae bacterium]|nr:TfoX/Sxy family protein [Lachnospiraceae bacterium]